ncbi:MAG: hypothetical protein K6F92_08480 [Lachnospiraceae bacterium]|nr:hypothetical protein [Lachnospiraceae bacterium]
MFGKLFKKTSAVVMAATMMMLSSVVAFADAYEEGQEVSGVAIQIVVQNDNSAENAFKWMNDGVFENPQYQTEQHVVLKPAADAFALTDDVCKMTAIYFGYYGEYSSIKDIQFDITMKNIVVYGTDYDGIALADYSSVDAGTNIPKDASHSIIYDFKDQFGDAATRTYAMQHLDRIEFDLYISYVEIPGVEAITEEETTEEPTTEAPTTEAPTTEAATTLAIEDGTQPQVGPGGQQMNDGETPPAPPENGGMVNPQQESSDNGMVKTIIIIVFAVILLGALVGVGIMYMKRR